MTRLKAVDRSGRRSRGRARPRHGRQNPARAQVRDSRLSVLRGLLKPTDDEYVDRPALRIELETELLLQRRKERRTVGVDRRQLDSRRRRTRRQLIWRRGPLQIDIVRACQA